MKKFFEGYAPGAHPMAILSSMIVSMSTYYPESNKNVDLNIVRLLSKAATIAAFAYKKSIGQPFIYPQNSLSYTGNFLRMMFAVPAEPTRSRRFLKKPSTCCLSCTQTTSRIARRRRFAWWAPVEQTFMHRWPPVSALFGDRFMGEPTRRSSRCSR